MKYLLDTCVFSELLRKTPNPTVRDWIDTHEPFLYLSVLTLGDLYKGIAKLSDESRKKIYQDWIEEDLSKRFENRILPVEGKIACLWGELLGESESRGIKLPVIDSLIAATALFHDLVVVTRNVPDLAACGTRVLNPWTLDDRSD